MNSDDDKPREACCTGLPRNLDCKLCPDDPEKAPRSSVVANELAPHQPDAEVKRFFNVWWREQTLKGDPSHRQHLSMDAYLAGFRKANEIEYSAR